MRSHKKRFTARNVLFTIVTISLVGLAVNQQLQRPPQ